MSHDDHRPPRLYGDERTNLVSMLDYVRDAIIRKTTDLSDLDARYNPVALGDSILRIVLHLARAETLWIIDRFAGERSTRPGLTTP